MASPQRRWMIGADGEVHIEGAERGLCGADLSRFPQKATTFPWCEECCSIAREIERLAAVAER